MHFFTFLISLIFSSGLVFSQGPRQIGPSIAPPAGRPLLSRSAHLEAWDFPAHAREGFDSRLHRHDYYSALGPPGFWTEDSLQKHYLNTVHLRYHPRLFPTPPPFNVWLKEQKLIRAINMLTTTIRIETTRDDVTQDALLHHEMQLGELSALLRQLQIATTLEYASLAPEWRRFEESMYRHWSSFLAVSQNEAMGAENLEYWKEHLEYLEEIAKEKAEEDERERLESEAEKEAIRAGKGQVKDGTEINVERAGLEASTPRRWLHTPDIAVGSSDGSKGVRAGLESSTPKRWPHTPNVASSSGEDVVKGLQEAVAKGLHLG